MTVPTLQGEAPASHPPELPWLLPSRLCFTTLFVLSLTGVVLFQFDNRSALAGDDQPLGRERPVIKGDRWREHWSPLADRDVKQQQFDRICCEFGFYLSIATKLQKLRTAKSTT